VKEYSDDEVREIQANECLLSLIEVILEGAGMSVTYLPQAPTAPVLH
jgi:hypothetical protein